MEIERKFLVAELPKGYEGASSAHLRQGYLVNSVGGSARIRAADDVRTLTVKSGSGLVREEYEIAITPEQFETLWPATAGRRLEKRRYRLPLGDLTVELDVFEGSLAGLVYAEVEFPAEADAVAFVPPAWFGREVTGDPAYTNSSLARNGLPPGALGT